jgi:hypothetical protein
MSIPSRWPSHADAVKARWFSRRHETNAAHRAEQEKREARLDARREREAAAREAEAQRREERKQKAA